MAKIKNDYFKLIEEQVSLLAEASDLLETIFSTYSVDTVVANKEKMHDIEHKADEIHHRINNSLASEFITPIDQEDILRLVQIIDDITDAVDEVVLYFYMYMIDEITPDAHILAKNLSRCIHALFEAAKELRNFKKPDTLRRLLVEVNSIESEADEAFTEAIHNLFKDTADVKRLIGNKAIYECLEDGCDLCEHAADVIEQIIIKNT